MPTVLQVIPSLDTGGAEKTTIDIGRALVADGWRSLVISSGGRLVSELLEHGSEHIEMNVATKNPIHMVHNVFKISNIIKQHKVDLIHARSRAPAWSSLAASKMTKTPFVTTYHGAYSQNNSLKAFYNSVMTRSNSIIANSKWTADLIENRHPKSKELIKVIPRGTDFEQFDPANISSHRKDKLLELWEVSNRNQMILQLARITHWKGQLVLIDAFAEVAGEFPNAIVILAGDHQGRQTYLNEIKERIKLHELSDRVKITGHCDDPSAAMAVASVAVVASIEPEAFGRAAVEAEALETPVIVSNLGAVQETVLAPPLVDEELRTGWIIPSANSAALASALREVMSLDNDSLRKLGERARSHCLDSFSLEQMTVKTLSIYSDLTES